MNGALGILVCIGVCLLMFGLFEVICVILIILFRKKDKREILQDDLDQVAWLEKYYNKKGECV